MKREVGAMILITYVIKLIAETWIEVLRSSVSSDPFPPADRSAASVPGCCWFPAAPSLQLSALLNVVPTASAAERSAVAAAVAV